MKMPLPGGETESLVMRVSASASATADTCTVKYMLTSG